MSEFNFEKQEIITGSSRLISKKKKFDRISYASDHMDKNMAYKAYLEHKKVTDKDKKILDKFKKSFLDYRKNWNDIPKKNYNLNTSDYNDQNLNILGPLCVDIEIASICDLACPHCFREYILTPDKIMNFDLYKRIIDEIKDMGVPSIKLNWRGEPLLNSRIDEFIKYAKLNGILEVSINTNASHLSKEMAKKLINSGLDLIIYSFDGGTKKTYEKMRPGRFKYNKFENIYENIKNFAEIKKELKSFFPITKIQMVLTNDTRTEIKNFYDLFNDIVDDVTVTPYSERGGGLENLEKTQKNKILNFFKKHKLAKDTPYIVSADGKIKISNKRKPCAQIFQRLMITYDGRVAMCCMDWGAQHCIGYVDKTAFELKNTLDELKRKIDSNKKGFELLRNAKYPSNFNQPKEKVETLKEIWTGKQINKVRNLHKENKINQVEICKKCDFTDTYEWREIE